LRKLIRWTENLATGDEKRKGMHGSDEEADVATEQSSSTAKEDGLEEEEVRLRLVPVKERKDEAAGTE
jgi:hypothetical protein